MQSPPLLTFQTLLISAMCVEYASVGTHTFYCIFNVSSFRARGRFLADLKVTEVKREQWNLLGAWGEL